MTPEDLISQIISLLDFHADTGYLRQEPYRGDVFKLFAEAYLNGFFDTGNVPSLKGDALREIIWTRWSQRSDFSSRAERHRELLDQLLPMWEEWIYAWDRFHEFNSE